MKWILWFSLFIVLIGCESQTGIQLQSGDVIFRGSGQSVLSSSIDEVTQTDDSTHYSHMGVLECQEGECYVWHSEPKKGVRKQTLSDFIEHAQQRAVHVYRPIVPFDENKVVSTLESYNKQPYNYTYVFEDEGVYCSELVYLAFARDSVFELHEMTFKAADVDTFMQGWVDYYDSLGVDVPEGKLGCNPNGMAASKSLEFLTDLTRKD